jgi:DnaJ-class molecular chaperone
MAGSIDPTLRSAEVVRTEAPPTPDPCAWCFGAGKYLEALACGVEHVYLPVVCEGCAGTGRRTSAT